MFEHRIIMKYNNYPNYQSKMKQRICVIVKKVIKLRSKFKIKKKRKTEETQNNKEKCLIVNHQKGSVEDVGVTWDYSTFRSFDCIIHSI